MRLGGWVTTRGHTRGRSRHTHTRRCVHTPTHAWSRPPSAGESTRWETPSPCVSRTCTPEPGAHRPTDTLPVHTHRTRIYTHKLCWALPINSQENIPQGHRREGRAKHGPPQNRPPASQHPVSPGQHLPWRSGLETPSTELRHERSDAESQPVHPPAALASGALQRGSILTAAEPSPCLH